MAVQRLVSNMISDSRFIKGGLLIAALALLASTGFISTAVAQQKRETVPAAPLLTRTTTRQETRRLGYGSTVTIVGAPQGSITVEGWPQSEVQVTADIELRAETEEDLNRLAAVNSWVLDDDANHLSILSTGTHTRFSFFGDEKFPKKLLGLPWKIASGFAYLCPPISKKCPAWPITLIWLRCITLPPRNETR